MWGLFEENTLMKNWGITLERGRNQTLGRQSSFLSQTGVHSFFCYVTPFIFPFLFLECTTHYMLHKLVHPPKGFQGSSKNYVTSFLRILDTLTILQVLKQGVNLSCFSKNSHIQVQATSRLVAHRYVTGLLRCLPGFNSR